MIALNARFDGKVIVPETPLALPPNQRLRVQVETIGEPNAPGAQRILGMQRGQVLSISQDFDAELGDDFWLGEKS